MPGETQTVLTNSPSESKHLSISWVQNMKVLRNRPRQGHKHMSKPCMSKTCCHVLHQTNSFSGHCHNLSSPVRRILRKSFAAAEPCRTHSAPPTLLQAGQQCHKELSLWGHLTNQAGYTESTEGRQQKAQGTSELP